MVGVTCNGATANQICAALAAGTNLVVACDGNTWNVGVCGLVPPTIELGVEPNCACVDGAHTVRPCINNQNWGGVATNSCNAAAQTLTVECNL